MFPSATLHELLEDGMRPFFAPPRAGKVPALPIAYEGFSDAYSALLEFRIGEAGGPVDLAWSQFRRDFAIPAVAASEEPWKTLGRFGELWRADEAAFRSIPCVVYEIDSEGDRFGRIPAIFFNRIKGNADSVAAIYNATSALFGRPRSPGTEALLRRVVDLLPPGALVLCIGYMLSRPDAPLRFEMSQIEPYEALPVYLKAIGWPGDIGQVERVVAALPNLARDLHTGLAFDVADTIGPRLGLEFTFKHHTDHAAALSRGLDDLIAAGLCIAEWRETLNAWKDSAITEQVLGILSRRTDFTRIVSHFKIVFDGQGIGAKCYVECIPHAMLEPSRWMQPAIPVNSEEK